MHDLTVSDNMRKQIVLAIVLQIWKIIEGMQAENKYENNVSKSKPGFHNLASMLASMLYRVHLLVESEAILYRI